MNKHRQVTEAFEQLGEAKKPKAFKKSMFGLISNGELVLNNSGIPKISTARGPLERDSYADEEVVEIEVNIKVK